MPTRKTPSQPGPLALMLRAGRLQSGLTQGQAAEALGVSRYTVNHWERGRSQPQSAASIARLAALYHLDADALYIAAGIIPPDLRAWIEANPPLLRQLRQLHAKATQSPKQDRN